MERDGTEADRGLVRAAAGGERRALGQLAQRLLPVVRAEVRATLRRTGAGPGDADDLVQDALLNLLEDGARRLQSWDPDLGLQLTGFARLITRRFSTRRAKPGRDELVEPEWFDDFGLPNSSSSFELRDQIDVVLSELDLRGRDRELFDRLVLTNEASASVAKALGMSDDAVRKWRSRFYDRARKTWAGLDASNRDPSTDPRST